MKKDTAQVTLEVLKNIKQTLNRANETLGGPMVDTIWYGPNEMLFDYIDASISAIEADIAQTVEPACLHTIVDARNKLVSSGYVCLKCGALFAAGDHGTTPTAKQPQGDKP